MKSLFIAGSVVAVTLIACNGPTLPSSGSSTENTLVESPGYTGVIFSESNALGFRFMFHEASTEFWEPSIDEVARAEACIRQLLDSAQDNPDLDASQKANAPFILENLQEYRRQYVGIVVDGEKRIWCNAFLSHDAYQDWQTRPVYVLDGGRDFWEIEYVLDRDECTDFYIHGEA